MKKTLTMSLISYLLEPVDTWKALKSLTNSWGRVVRYLKQDATIRCTFIFAYQFSDEIWFTVVLTITYINMKIDLHMLYFDKTPICTVQGFILYHLATRTSSICDGGFFQNKTPHWYIISSYFSIHR
jgi:hypothetical protein